MKIILVIPAAGGSRSLGENVDFALRRLGHDVILFDVSKHGSREIAGSDDDIAQVNQNLVNNAIETKADFVLTMALSPVSAQALDTLRTYNIVSSHYFCEDLNVTHLWQSIIRHYDHFFVIQDGPLLAECRSLNKKTHYIPNGAPVEFTNTGTIAKDVEVSFAGSPYENRVKFFEELSETDLNFKIWGHGWDFVPTSPRLKQHIVDGRRWLSYPELFHIFSRSRITINLHSTLNGMKIEKDGDFLNPRTFTIPLCRTLQLCDRRNVLLDFFTEGRDIVCFDSVAELLSASRYYLEHEDSANSIVEQAYSNVAHSHLLTHRLERLLAHVFGEELAPPEIEVSQKPPRFSWARIWGKARTS